MCDVCSRQSCSRGGPTKNGIQTKGTIFCFSGQLVCCRLVRQQIFHGFADVRTWNTTNSFDRRNRLKWNRRKKKKTTTTIFSLPLTSSMSIVHSMVACARASLVSNYIERFTLRSVCVCAVRLRMDERWSVLIHHSIRIECVNRVLDACINWIGRVTRNALESCSCTTIFMTKLICIFIGAILLLVKIGRSSIWPIVVFVSLEASGRNAPTHDDFFFFGERKP